MRILSLLYLGTFYADLNGTVHLTLNKTNYTQPNNCISFTVGSGTGCAWMCSYCASSLNTNNYYFNPAVCTYQQGGCVGNPQPGVSYTCCSA
jgi:hypothetical protein